MKIKRLKELVSGMDDELDIFVRNSVNPCGNIQELAQIEVSTYGCFGASVPCLILNTDSSKKLETTAEDEIVEVLYA